MVSEGRRRFLKRSGAALGLGATTATGGLVLGNYTSTRSTAGRAASSANGSESTTGDDSTSGTALPPLRGPYADEDWVSDRGGPGDSAAISESPDVNPDHVECTCLYEGNISSDVAIVGDTMYLSEFLDDTWHVRAIDAHDGSRKWTSDGVRNLSPPAAAYGRIIVATDDGLLALDVEDGRVDWERQLGGETSGPTVAYETVYATSDGAIYAVDVEDGSVRWKRTPGEAGAVFRLAPVASNGRVYAPVDREDESTLLVALDAATGERQWGDDWGWDGYNLAATEEWVTGDNGEGGREFRVVEADTGDGYHSGATTSGVFSPALDDEVLVTTAGNETRAVFFDDREGWDFGPFSTHALGPPTIAGDTVYVYVGADDEQYDHAVVALDKASGDVTWSQAIPDSGESRGYVVATSDAVYGLIGVFSEAPEIHVMHGEAVDHDH